MTNEVLKAIETRRSCKAFRPEQIKPEELDAILKAGTFAPTGRNKQAPVMVVLQNKEDVAELSALNAQIMGTTTDPFYGAPTVIVVLAETEPYTWVEDGSLVMANLMLAASSLGVGSCWIHRARQEFDSEQGKALLKKWGLPETLRGVGHCILGYPAENAYAKPRSPRKDGYIVKI